MKSILLVLALVVAGTVYAQRPVNRRSAGKAPVKKEADKKEEEKKEDQWLLIKNVDVYPVNGMIQRNAEILVKNDKIHSIGKSLDAPKEHCETVDGDGMRAYPGLIALNGGGLTPSLRGKGASLDPKGLLNQLVLAHGITTVVSGTTAFKLDAHSTDVILRSGLYTGLQYSTRNPRAKKQVREDMSKALVYLRASRTSMNAKEKAEASKKLGSASRYLPILEGKQIAVFNVDERQDILDACDLAESFGFKAVIRGAAEGWTVPGAMGRANVSALLMPRMRRDPDEKLDRDNGSNMANAAILYEHGVVVGIASQQASVDADGGPGRDGLAVAWDAGAAVGGGLPEAAALKGITLNAARIYALDDRIGSIEVGKDADIVICDGEMLHYKTQVYFTVVNGKVSYDRSKVALYQKIRPRNAKEGEKEAQWWPRPITPMPDAWRHDPAAEDKKIAAEKAKADAKAKAKADAEAKKKAAKAKKKKAPKKTTEAKK